MKTENMKFPLGPRVRVSAEGSTSLKVSMEEEIISFRAVLMPMLKKRMMKTLRTATEMTPPRHCFVVCVPFVSEEGRSTVLKMFAKQEQQDGIDS